MRGYVFTLDAAFAVIIVGVLLLMVYSYPITSYSSGADIIAIRRTASDIVAVLDYNDVLDTLDNDTIAQELNQLLPHNLGMSMTLDVYDSDLDFEYQIQVNPDLDGDYYTGKWRFPKLTGSQIDKYVLVEYKVGLR